uniref:Uncharacterized protein n=1 Tax=Vespula pensylvanica TaxID=30213 RepID=A0A834MYY5_VESPE|nr:hypothetical protein H0235_018174 [Vespula pensylvanica]
MFLFVTRIITQQALPELMFVVSNWPHTKRNDGTWCNVPPAMFDSRNDERSCSLSRAITKSNDYDEMENDFCAWGSLRDNIELYRDERRDNGDGGGSRNGVNCGRDQRLVGSLTAAHIATKRKDLRSRNPDFSNAINPTGNKKSMSTKSGKSRRTRRHRTDGRRAGQWQWWQTRGGTKEDEVGGNLTPGRIEGWCREKISTLVAPRVEE